MNKEKEILTYMKNLDISREEAEQLWQDDHDDVVTPEMAEMEKKAKKIKRYEKSDAPKKARERKVDPDKKELIQFLDDALCDFVDNVHTVKNEAEISFTYNNAEYTVKLIKHRAPK